MGGVRVCGGAGGAAAQGEGDGKVSYGEAFAVQPFGNSLVVKTLTGQQIYDLLNQQWALNQPPQGRVLQVSRGFTYRHRFVPSVSPLGGSYVCEGSAMLNGTPIDRAASYRVAMNSFLATGGDNFTMFNQGIAQLGGDVDLDALAAYFSTRSAVSPGPRDRIVQVAACS